MKNIWLVNHYAMPPELEPRPRTVKLAEYLIKRGFQVTIFGASSMHNTKINLIDTKVDYIEKQYGQIKFVHIRVKSYSNHVQRVRNLVEFSLRLKKVAREFDNPDVILYTAAVPFGNITYFTARKVKAKFYVEVLDLWPESFIMTGIIKKGNPIMPFLYFCEKWLYKRADRLIFSMEGGKKYIKDRRWDKLNKGPIDLNKVSHINNGVDLVEFDSNLQQYTMEDADLSNDSTFKIVYIGSIRLFNNIGLIIEAAEQLREYKEVVFLIYGDGDEREKLQNYVIENALTNVKFKEKFIDKKYIPYLLSKSSINILNYQQNGIWKYGGSQSKLFQYLASGKPIVSNTVSEFCLIRRYDCGISNEFVTGNDYAEAFLQIKCLPEKDYQTMCHNAREAAKDYDYEKLTDDFIKLL